MQEFDEHHRSEWLSGHDAVVTRSGVSGLSPHRRVMLAVVTFILWGALFVLIIPPLRSGVAHLFVQQRSATTSTLTSQQFWFTSNLPWGTITVDEKLQSFTPTLAAPLILGRGHHQITYTAPPFLPQSCRLSVPFEREDTCVLGASDTITPSPTAVSFRVSLTNLASSQQKTLIVAIQLALQSIQSTTTIAVGEGYAASAMPATIALQATLSFTLDTGTLPGIQCPMILQKCLLQQQDCHQLCALDQGLIPAQRPMGQPWQVYALAFPLWQIASPEGTILGEQLPDGYGGAAQREGLVQLAIQWDGTTWLVSLPAAESVPPSTSLTPVDIGCMSAQNTLQIDGLTAVARVNNIPLGWQFIPASDRAQGCLVTATPQFNAATPATPDTAYLLYRFGRFVVVNAIAQSFWPDLPVGDSIEQGIAQQLAAHS